MIRPDLRYHRPETATEVTELLLRHDGDVAVLGGGTQLLPKMTRDEISVSHLVDLRGLGLRQIQLDADSVTVGSLVTYDDVLRSPSLAETVPHLARVSAGVTGGRQIRNIATLLGAVCFGMPGTDMPAALVGLGARYRIHGPRGFHVIRSENFHLGPFQVALGPGEFLHSMIIDRQPRITGYCKVKHSAGSWPIVTASYCLDSRGPSITLGSVEGTPLRVDLERADASREEIVELVRQAINAPWSDVHAPAQYRVRIAGVVAFRAYLEAREASQWPQLATT